LDRSNYFSILTVNSGVLSPLAHVILHSYRSHYRYILVAFFTLNVKVKEELIFFVIILMRLQHLSLLPDSSQDMLDGSQSSSGRDVERTVLMPGK
jgi:hypothetical protein